MPEVVADVEQGIARDVSGRVSQAIAKIERRLVPSASIAGERRAGGVPFFFPKRHNRYPELAHKVSHLTVTGRFSPSREHERRFNERRRADANGVGFENPINEFQIPRFREQDSDQR